MEQSHGGQCGTCICMYDQRERVVKTSLDFLICIKVRLYLLD